MNISVLHEVQVGICVPLYKHVGLLARGFFLTLIGISIYQMVYVLQAFISGGCQVNRRHLVPCLTFFTDMDTLLAILVANLTSRGNKRIMAVRRKICQNWGGGRTL